jgi:hypothetical protein
LHIDKPPFERERRMPRDDKEIADARERRCDFLDHAVGKILVGRTAEIVERHDGDRGGAHKTARHLWGSSMCDDFDHRRVVQPAVVSPANGAEEPFRFKIRLRFQFLPQCLLALLELPNGGIGSATPHEKPHQSPMRFF